MRGTRKKKTAPISVDDDQNSQDRQQDPQNVSHSEDEPSSFSFAPPPQTDTDDGFKAALKKVGAAFGIEPDKPETEEKKPAKADVRGMTKAQRDMYDMLTPMAVMAFVAAAGWAWARLGGQYRILAPSNDVATKIVAPLVRVWARNSKFTASVTPDMRDIGASIAALLGYVWASLEMFEAIRKETEEDENASTVQNGTYSAAGRYASLTESNGKNAYEHLTDEDIGINSLNESERAQYEALARLREQDFRARARRSARHGQF